MGTWSATAANLKGEPYRLEQRFGISPALRRKLKSAKSLNLPCATPSSQATGCTLVADGQGNISSSTLRPSPRWRRTLADWPTSTPSARSTSLDQLQMTKRCSRHFLSQKGRFASDQQRAKLKRTLLPRVATWRNCKRSIRKRLCLPSAKTLQKTSTLLPTRGALTSRTMAT